MEKHDLIKSILKFNQSTSEEFLARFTASDLQAYLDRISLVCCDSIIPRVAKPKTVRPTIRRPSTIRSALRATRTFLEHIGIMRRMQSYNLIHHRS